jgi:hypothetical protein
LKDHVPVFISPPPLKSAPVMFSSIRFPFISYYSRSYSCGTGISSARACLDSWLQEQLKCYSSLYILALTGNRKCLFYYCVFSPSRGKTCPHICCNHPTAFH